MKTSGQEIAGGRVRRIDSRVKGENQMRRKRPSAERAGFSSVRATLGAEDLTQADKGESKDILKEATTV